METFKDLREREIRPNYNVHKLHHYTTMMGLSSILRKGYIEARESKGDADFGDMIKNHKAVSFLDGDYDNELEQFYSCNDQGRTLEGLTFHLGLHQKTVCALIEVDLDKLPEDNEVEFLETITWNALREVDEWNDDIYDGDEFYHNIKTLYETKMEFYNNKNYDSDQLKAALRERGVSEDFINNSHFRRDCEFDRYGDPFPDYSRSVMKSAVDHVEGSRGVKLEKMSDEEIAKMKKAIEDGVDVFAGCTGSGGAGMVAVVLQCLVKSTADGEINAAGGTGQNGYDLVSTIDGCFGSSHACQHHSTQC